MLDQHQIFTHSRSLDYELENLTRKIDDISRAGICGSSAEVRQIIESTLKQISAIIATLKRTARGEIKLEATSVPLKKKLDEIICQIAGENSPHICVENNVSERFHVFTFWDILRAILEICLTNSLTAIAGVQDSKLELSCKFDEDRSEYTIEILNTGHIPDYVLNAIRNRHPVLSKTKAKGIGLLIANNQLDLLGGSLEISNSYEGVLTKLKFGDLRWPLEF